MIRYELPSIKIVIIKKMKEKYWPENINVGKRTFYTVSRKVS